MRTSFKAAALALAICTLLGTFTGISLAANAAPTAENLEISTYRGVSVGGRLSAVDPEGDALRYEISTYPVKGEIELEEDGSFIYTPADGKRGKDYFGYVALDSEGNRSQEATVIIRLLKQRSCVSYTDMEGSAAHYAAVLPAENDIFVGECVGGQYLFRPEAAVSRGEFLAMCMKAAGSDVLGGASSTGFSDDGEIPSWIKPYVATALYEGDIAGYTDGGSPVFGSDAPVSLSEAVVMLNNVFDVSSAASCGPEAAVPSWAAQSFANLSACRVLPEGLVSMDQYLTRADAAVMLEGAMALRQE